MTINIDKNRNRDNFSFANINLLGKCNVNCFFCLGKDIKEELKPHNQIKTHFESWKNFYPFLEKCRENKVKKLYITGQNTDSLLYTYLDELIDTLHCLGFEVGLRTNGYEALNKINTINKCELSAGYSIHTLVPASNKLIMCRSDLPDWEKIIPATERPRVSVVLNRHNKDELFSVLKYLVRFPNIRYIQIRRISTDARVDELMPDMLAYEEVYTQVKQTFKPKEILWQDAEVYDIYGQDVVFWRTIRTSVNSLNYFTDGTISDMYFVVEGYKKNFKRG